MPLSYSKPHFLKENRSKRNFPGYFGNKQRTVNALLIYTDITSSFLGTDLGFGRLR